ncbi:MAG: TIGR04086 family membrane protein [Firmicutes bacterium]|nr:TIGR04086 family membrane protein [Bacillota bacterium]
MKTNVKLPILAILRGLVTSFWLTLAALLICAAAMTLSGGLDENTVYIALHITSLAAVFAGSLTAARRIQSRGMLYGLAIGLLYTLIMVFMGFMITPAYNIGPKTLLTLVISLSGGALGGILGINLR